MKNHDMSGLPLSQEVKTNSKLKISLDHQQRKFKSLLERDRERERGKKNDNSNLSRKLNIFWGFIKLKQKQKIRNGQVSCHSKRPIDYIIKNHHHLLQQCAWQVPAPADASLSSSQHFPSPCVYLEGIARPELLHCAC